MNTWTQYRYSLIQECAKNTGDGYGSEPWQTFPHVNSIEEEEWPQQVHEWEHLSHDGGTSENEDDHGLGDDATYIDVIKDDFEELLDTMSEHEDVDHIEEVVVEENETHAPVPILCWNGSPKTLGIICLIHHQLCKRKYQVGCLGSSQWRGWYLRLNWQCDMHWLGTQCKRILTSKLSIQTQRGLWWVVRMIHVHG